MTIQTLHSEFMYCHMGKSSFKGTSLLYAYREALKDILREVKSENNNSLTHMATDHIVLAVREKLKARSIGQLTPSVPMTTTATPTVFPSAFPSQSQLGVSEPGVGVSSTTAQGSVLLPMAQNAAMWSMRPSQPSQVCLSASLSAHVPATPLSVYSYTYHTPLCLLIYLPHPSLHVPVPLPVCLTTTPHLSDCVCVAASHSEPQMVDMSLPPPDPPFTVGPVQLGGARACTPGCGSIATEQATSTPPAADTCDPAHLILPGISPWCPPS